MLLGIGIDLCSEARIANTYRRFGQRFISRICSQYEQQQLLSVPENRIVRRLTMLFATKEAMAKALGTGFRHGIAWRDLEHFANEFGKPGIRVHNASARRLQQLAARANPDGANMQLQCELSISTELGTTAAMVVIALHQKINTSHSGK